MRIITNNDTMKKMTSLGWMICGVFLMCAVSGSAQSTLSSEGESEILTLEKALEIAYQNSPTLRQSKISLEQSQNSLISRRASLKSQFSLELSPFGYSRNSSFQELTSEWYTFRSMTSSGTFSCCVSFTDAVSLRKQRKKLILNICFL